MLLFFLFFLFQIFFRHGLFATAKEPDSFSPSKREVQARYYRERGGRSTWTGFE